MPNDPIQPIPPAPRRRRTFAEDFRRFFLRGLGTLLPTIITVALIWWVIDFLWNSIGWYIIEAIKRTWYLAVQQGWVEPTSAGYIRRVFEEAWWNKPLGVVLALVLIYLVGLLVGNFLGRAIYRTAEAAVLRIPVIRALYPAVKQVTDFLLADKEGQFEGSRVVAVRPHENDIWSIALVTGSGLAPLTARTRRQMVTVFVPSSPTAFSGYVMLAPREEVVELPMSVEEAMRLLVSGGVIVPGKLKGATSAGNAPQPASTPVTPAHPAEQREDRPAVPPRQPELPSAPATSAPSPASVPPEPAM